MSIEERRANSFDVDPASNEALALSLLAKDEGFDSIDELVKYYALKSIMPGCCMHCYALTLSLEPDQDAGWCHRCETTEAKSINVLAGLC